MIQALIIEINKLNNTAHQKPSTVNPGTMWLVKSISKALITKRNKPNVRIVIGKVKIIKIGFKKTFRKESTIATAKAVTKFSTWIPGNR